ncbi:MAG: class I SAM-dependent RNA methyltransferase [Bacteroidetes bacterium]|nr:class I SAM-dependent RNA methyltransferase [Bacteroidota bacterium]
MQLKRRALKLLAKTLYGLEPILAKELESLGAQNISEGNRAVSFEGDKELLYRANLELRTALRILVPIASFRARDDKNFYQQAKKIEWKDYLDNSKTFAIDSTTYSETFKHSQYASSKLKDAIVDKFKEETGERPSVYTFDPDFKINLHISNNDINISLDSTGESLEKRGYRRESNEAPISEVLAAGIIIKAWDGTKPLMDPMCGSGTFLIEAAMIASKTAPSLNRSFTFKNWNDFDAELFEKIELELKERIAAPTVSIVGKDIDGTSISKAERNAERAGVLDMIQFEKQDFLESKGSDEESIIVMNPPYGKRIEFEKALLDAYHEIGSRLKHHYPGNTVWVIGSNIGALKKLGLKAASKTKLFNGPLECQLHEYKLFAGKRVDQIKDKK